MENSNGTQFFEYLQCESKCSSSPGLRTEFMKTKSVLGVFLGVFLECLKTKSILSNTLIRYNVLILSGIE